MRARVGVGKSMAVESYGVARKSAERCEAGVIVRREEVQAETLGSSDHVDGQVRPPEEEGAAESDRAEDSAMASSRSDAHATGFA
jgi:hypothetical protein